MSRPLPIAYAFDEEADGFGVPQDTPSLPPENPLARFALVGIALGVLSFASQVAGGPFLAGLPVFKSLAGSGVGGWLALLSGLPLAALSMAVYYWLSLKGTTPGIKHDGIFFGSMTARGTLAWIAGLGLTGFYVVLYWLPGAGAISRMEAGAGFPAQAKLWVLQWTSVFFERAIGSLDPLAMALSGKPADRWFLYGTLYTLAVLAFGVRMIMKYRHNRYQIVRTLSVMFFQLGFGFLIPQILKAFRYPEYYFTYFWPLKYDYLFPGSLSNLWNTPGGVGVFMVFWGLAATFVATPVLTYFFGKRWYCSWVCGCGGLAETLGDPYRQLSSKSTTSWRIERWMIHSVLVFIVVTTVALWVTRGSASPFASGLRQWYGFLIGAAFSGVIGVGFYPLMGSRVWCRFGCPMAAILGLFQRFFSRFRITTNGGQCMSCGNCSTYCEMGIDVRAYAEKGENIVRASCVGCGVCAAVCPRGVLKLENGSTHADRYTGADNPVQSFIDALTQGPKVP